jgi:hypothetical protein
MAVAPWTSMCLRWSLGLVAALASGCVEAGRGPSDAGGGDDEEPVPDSGPVEEVRDAAPNGILCEARLVLAGTFEVAEPQPPDVSGCWPVGVWRFSAAIESGTCPLPLDLEDEYAFQVSRNAEESYQYTFLDDPAYPRVRMNVTSGGGGLCEGGFEVYSLDGTIVRNFKPALEPDDTLTGHADYEVYADDQW